MRVRVHMPWLIRVARLGLLVAAAAILHAAGKNETSQSSAIQLADARFVFPLASRIDRFDPTWRAYLVRGENDDSLGFIVPTSPESDDLIGYSGPSNVLVGMGLDGRILGVHLLSSRDTPAHVAQVREDQSFWQQFVGRSRDTLDQRVEGVSGSTLTSLAMAEGIERRLSGANRSLRFAQPLGVDEVRIVFPRAASMSKDVPRLGWMAILDAQGQTLGFAIRSSPHADNVIGYAGPTETWLAIDRDEHTVLAVRFRKSYDTAEYVERVIADEHYLESLAGRTVEQWANLDFKREGIEGVSGATQTSFAIAEGIRRRLSAIAAHDRQEKFAGWRPMSRDVGLALIVVGALAIGFTHLKGNRRVRRFWQLLLMVGFGLSLGDLLSLALLAGWAKNGIPWQTAPSLVLLVSVALLIPWTTRRQIYCHHLCPHGAAQEWIGRFRRFQVRMPERWSHALAWIPYLLLAVAFALSITVSQFDLSLLEPFDAWVLRQATLVPAILAVVGLIASLFQPMAYCRFGCPTGALLKIVRSHAAEQIRWHDGVALALVVVGAIWVWRPPSRAPSREAKPATTVLSSQFSGQAFGTTWNVKFRAQVPNEVEREIAAELQRIERSFSHWHAESETSQFNASRTTQAMEVSRELIQLVAFGRGLSEKTDGAFDLTVAPLVDAWSFGPSGKQSAPPSEDQIADLLKRVGWQKLVVNEETGTLRKRPSGVTVDLGALLQGYAADRVGELLDRRGVRECLIEIGGELKARGTWQVVVEDPSLTGQSLRKVTLRDGALATSGVYRAGRHIIDPRTGQSVASPWQLVAVVQPTCLAADGWATALLASGDRALDVANRENIPTLMVDHAGQVTFGNADKEKWGE